MSERIWLEAVHRGEVREMAAPPMKKKLQDELSPRPDLAHDEAVRISL